MAKGKKPSNARAWALAAKRNVRTCETCRDCSKECLAFVAEAWALIRSGESSASRQELHREIVRRFQYPYSCSGFRNHTDHLK